MVGRIMSKETIIIIFLWMQYLSNAEICHSSVCEYEFRVRMSRTMTYYHENKAYNVRVNGTRLQIVSNKFHKDDPLIGTFIDSKYVITADGVERSVITVNDKFPGPTIKVMKGAQVVVKVVNELATDGLTIHWHGLYVTKTPWMDGVAYITQCPILPKKTFIYRFLADPPGTHFYHGHMGLQRLDGLFGFLIIYSNPPQIPFFQLSIQDWVHEDGESIDILHAYRKTRPGSGQLMLAYEDRDYSADGIELSAMRYQSGLINGRGRYNNMALPLTEYKVEASKRIGFHVIHAGGEYSYKLSIDNHLLSVVASDGFPLHPIKVHYVIINPGETYDIEITTNQQSNKYWIRAETLRSGRGPRPKRDGKSDEIKGILSYLSFARNTTSEPVSRKHQCSNTSECTIFNCPFQGLKYSDHIRCYGFETASSTLPKAFLDAKYGLNDPNIREHFINFGFNIGSNVNGYKFHFPSSPFFFKGDNGAKECNDTKCKSGCQCTYRLKLPFNKTVQMVLTNYHQTFDNTTADLGHHVVHLHGHSFAVLTEAYPPYDKTTGYFVSHNRDIECESPLCRHPRWKQKPKTLNLNNPPIKDTIMIPARGYVVIRFRTDNPGYWLFHCHQETHSLEGMEMLIEEAVDMIPSPPSAFPECSNFEWTSDDYYQNLRNGVTKSKNSAKEGKERKLRLTMAQAVGLSCAIFLLGAFVAILITTLAGEYIKRKIHSLFSTKNKKVKRNLVGGNDKDENKNVHKRSKFRSFEIGRAYER